MRDPIEEFMTYNRPFAQRNPELLRLQGGRVWPTAAFAASSAALSTCTRATSWIGTRFRCRCSPTTVPNSTSSATSTARTMALTRPAMASSTTTSTTSTRRHTAASTSTSAGWRRAFSWRRKNGNDPLPQAVMPPVGRARPPTPRRSSCCSKRAATSTTISTKTILGAYVPVSALVAASAAAAKRNLFITRLTEWKGQSTPPSFPFDTLFQFSGHAEGDQVVRLLTDYRKRLKVPVDVKNYFNVEDICGRISGIGSMGRYRYVASPAARARLADAQRADRVRARPRPSAYDLYRNRDTDADALVRRAEPRHRHATAVPGNVVSLFLGYAHGRQAVVSRCARLVRAMSRRCTQPQDAGPAAKRRAGTGRDPGPYPRPGRSARHRPDEPLGGVRRSERVLSTGAGLLAAWATGNCRCGRRLRAFHRSAHGSRECE